MVDQEAPEITPKGDLRPESEACRECAAVESLRAKLIELDDLSADVGIYQLGTSDARDFGVGEGSMSWR